MQISKNKKHQYLFFLLIFFCAIFNGGNNNLIVQFNFIFTALLFLLCLNDKNYNHHLKYIYKKNQTSIYFYLLFLLYLFFQIVPLPLNILKIFFLEKNNFIQLLNEKIYFSTIILAPVNSFFKVIHFITIFNCIYF